MLVASPIVLAALRAFLDKTTELNHSGDRGDRLKDVFAIIRYLRRQNMRLFVIPAAMLAISFAPVQQSQARGGGVFDPPVTIDFSRTATAEFSDGAKFDAMYSGLIESTAGFPFQPGPPAEGVTVTLTHDRIQTTTYAKFAATTGRALSPPIGAQVGDERTYSRTQGNIKETWTQEYRETGGSRRWVTTSYTWERVDDKDLKSEAPN